MTSVSSSPTGEATIASFFFDSNLCIHVYRTEGKGDKFRPPPLFSKVTAALTTPESSQDVKNMFENFVKELVNMKRRK